MNKTSREELKATIQTQFAMMSEMGSDNESLRAKLQAAEEIADRFDKFCSALEAMLPEAGDRTELLGCVAALRSRAEAAETAAQNHRQTIADKSETVSVARARIATLEGCLFAEQEHVEMLQAAEAEIAEWKEYNPTPAGLLAERKRANDAEADRDALSEKQGALSDNLQAAEAERDSVVHLLDEWENKNQALQAEVARLTITQEPLFSQRVLVPELRTRIAELEAIIEHTNKHEAHRLDIERRTATEAALRWAWDQGVQYDFPGTYHEWIATGLAALMNETNNQGETK